MEDDLCIGIDFGASNLRAAVYIQKAGECFPIPNDFLRTWTPSVVACGEDDCLVGEYAKSHNRDQQAGGMEVFFEVKRAIGGTSADAFGEKDGKPKGLPFKKTMSGFRANIPKMMKSVSVEDLLSLLLARIKRDAESFLSRPVKRDVKRAVIAVPGHFTAPQANAISSAAKRAGLDIRLVHELQAAARAFCFDNRGRSTAAHTGIVMLFDLGDSHLDIARADIQASRVVAFSHVIRDKATGGRVFDEIIRSRMYDSRPRGSAEVSSAPSRWRVKRDCVEVKEKVCSDKLSSKDEAYLPARVTPLDHGGQEVPTPRSSDFYSLIDSAVKGWKKGLDTPLSKIRSPQGPAIMILLALGRSCKIPSVRTMLDKFGSKFNCPVKYLGDDTIARGAAMMWDEALVPAGAMAMAEERSLGSTSGRDQSVPLLGRQPETSHDPSGDLCGCWTQLNGGASSGHPPYPPGGISYSMTASSVPEGHAYGPGGSYVTGYGGGTQYRAPVNANRQQWSQGGGGASSQGQQFSGSTGGIGPAEISNSGYNAYPAAATAANGQQLSCQSTHYEALLLLSNWSTMRFYLEAMKTVFGEDVIYSLHDGTPAGQRIFQMEKKTTTKFSVDDYEQAKEDFKRLLWEGDLGKSRRPFLLVECWDSESGFESLSNLEKGMTCFRGAFDAGLCEFVVAPHLLYLSEAIDVMKAAERSSQTVSKFRLCAQNFKVPAGESSGSENAATRTVSGKKDRASCSAVVQNQASAAKEEAVEEKDGDEQHLHTNWLTGNGFEYVIAGKRHRRVFESAEEVGGMVRDALLKDLKVIACIVDTNGLQDCREQLQGIRDKVDSEESWQNIVIAYEPVWPQEWLSRQQQFSPLSRMQLMVSFIRHWLATEVSLLTAHSTRIVYAGPLVKDIDVQSLETVQFLDGLLLQGASVAHLSQTTNLVDWIKRRVSSTSAGPRLPMQRRSGQSTGHEYPIPRSGVDAPRSPRCPTSENMLPAQRNRSTGVEAHRSYQGPIEVQRSTPIPIGPAVDDTIRGEVPPAGSYLTWQSGRDSNGGPGNDKFAMKPPANVRKSHGTCEDAPRPWRG
ncbi:hypothetical protein CBR_g17128 [Chara braunii]|uniref:Uncharacterized protein n=1 Tax=Chara braunii TaxID=69332 RepID=A0A388KUR8_CHABU|nr:hypothetical protein CBR_g17128 [Chara braunii]|eukprot:GBG73789.1 hypothetical protein CBR_g17128 [Chara braunii]